MKIGDFGLARKEVVVSPGGGSPLASLIEPLTPLFPPGMEITNITILVLHRHGHRVGIKLLVSYFRQDFRAKMHPLLGWVRVLMLRPSS